MRSARDYASIAAAAAVVLAMCVPGSARANGFANTSFIQPADLVAFQSFGIVAADGNVMAVGDFRSPHAVYVYAYDNGTWTQRAKLTSPTGRESDLFGQSLAVQGDTLVVGAAGAHAAYVYTSTDGQWMLQGTLQPTDGSGISFGGSVTKGIAISGNTVAIGAPAEATPAGNTGSVYVFTYGNGNWSEQARIVPTDPLVAGFGGSVALQGDTLLVGAPASGSAAVFEPGTAFVFARQLGTWSLEARLDPPDPVVFGLYGQCVSLDGNTAVIGAQRPSEAEVFVLNQGAWSLQQIIEGPDDSDFGTSVNVLGDMLMVTAYEDVSPIDFKSGAAHFYTRGGSRWTEHADLLMAPAVNGVAGPVQDGQRFGNFAAMTRAGSQTLFVFGSHNFSYPDIPQLGAVYTATLN